MNMKMSPSLILLPILLLLLTWLLFKGMNADSQRFEVASGALDDFQMTESALRRDILMARIGLLHNYDPLVRKMKVLRLALDRLREVSSSDPSRLAAIEPLADLVEQQEDLTEQFKSNNALLQNSLAYFELFSARLGASGKDGSLSPAVSKLGAAMLSFTLNTSPAIANDVQDRLDELARQPVSPADAESVETLLAHGRLLHDLLPKTDTIARVLLSLPNREAEEKLRSLIISRHDEARQTAQNFRLLLYAISLLLLAVLAHLGWRLRTRAQILQRRAAFEHVIAGISTRFINSQPAEIDAHIELALSQMARHLDAGWAFYTASCSGPNLHAWCREPLAFPTGWREEVSAGISRMTTLPEEIIQFPSDTLRRSLAVRVVGDSRPVKGHPPATGDDTCSWICVVRTNGNGRRSLLGFGLPKSLPVKQTAELGLLRMGLNAISNALARTTLERERTQLEARLQQARRMEVLGSFASGIAHNFNNIVGAILGYAEIAESQLTTNQQASATLDEIRMAGERARDLVDEILTFGRRGDGHREEVNLRDLMTEVVSLLHASLPTSIDLAVSDVPAETYILGVPAQLQQLIINLCNNAAQAMDESGRVEIDLCVHEALQPQVLTHGELTRGRYVCISVSDTGYGMEEAVLDRLFEPFFTTRQTGNGLGLATVYEIVRELGGAMNVQSVPGAGSRFEAWLPCTDAASMAAAENEPFYPFGQGQTLLLVGYGQASISADEEILAALGYEPVGFTRIADAVDACRVMPNRFDAVVLGQFVSVRTALDLAGILHELKPDLPILLTTPSIHQVDIGSLVTAGISEIVQRPIISTELAAALKRCLQDGATVPYGKLAS